MQKDKYFPCHYYYFIYLLTGIILGCLFSSYINKGDYVETLYVSQQEILELERSRVNNLSSSADKQLFYGKPSEAAELIEQIGESFASNKANVVFSNDKVYGSRVRSISKEVYEQTINELKVLHANQ